MTVDAYDVSFGHAGLSADDLHSVGARGVIGYVGGDRRKVMTADDVRRWHDAGLAVASVHEIGLDWRAWDSGAANRDADAIGQPGDRPIYYAVDKQVFAGEYQAISDRLGSMTGRPRGVYGGKGLGHFCLGARTAGWAWGTNATSFDNGDHDQHAIALQQLFNQSAIPATDRDVVMLDDWGQWPFQLPQGDEPVPAKIGQMVTPQDPNHPSHGEIVFVEDGSAVAVHVPDTHMVEVYRFLGVGGPVPIESEWFDALAILPTGHLKIPT